MLDTVQRFCRRTGLSVPTTVYGSNDEQVLQIMELLNEEGEDLLTRGDWQRLTFEALHTTVATESQGTIDSIATNGFDHIKSSTFWDRTENLPILSIDGDAWQTIKGFTTTTPRYEVRIRGGELLATPVPTAGNTWAFEYISKNWILDTDGTTYKQYFTADTDDILFPDRVVLKGLTWRWKREKGFDYAEDFNSYEALVKEALGADGMRRVLDQGRPENEASPRIVINQGNWPL
ncbi:MAG: hypothetical protein GWN00_19740 [Aliifodinibius sp.]|nr:hypothetical protein [Fodinibius sp.]NIY26955.1 hypothetical protein [Fodinibius sp.]